MSENKVLYYCGQALIWHPVDLNRAKLRAIAKWHIAFGRSSAYEEMKADRVSYIYYFGIPRYLMKGIIVDFFRVIIHVFNRRKLFNSLRKFFRKVGMIMEYRGNYESKLLKEKSHAKG